jgi:hypothetical protein
VGRFAALLALAACLAVPATAGAATAGWRLEQPPPPPGATFKVPLGTPGDLVFWAPNRGLLGVEGNSVVPRGILAWDGRSWHQLATVCGGPGDTMRIAFAGPREFWTVSEPSRPRQGSGTSLCHFKDGQVVASYGTADNAADPYRQMNSAACRGPSDCWFGGIGSQDPTGQRTGAFHLHWNGSSLTTEYNPQGRGVTDIEPFGTGYAESVVVGPAREVAEAPELAHPEDVPALLHRIGRSFTNDPFVPEERTGVPDDGSELLALDASGANAWAVGGGAASGPEADRPGGVVARPPLAVRYDGTRFRELDLDPLPDAFGPADRFEDVAAVPGTSDAWAALVPFEQREDTNVKAEVAHIDGAGGRTEVQALPASGAGRGAARRIAFPSATQGWLVTTAGWLFHYTDGATLPRDTDPAFRGPIDFRPNEAAEQFVPDAAPVDDSQLFAPPPVAVETQATPPPPKVKRLKPLLKRIRSGRTGFTVWVKFTLVRKARVQLLGKRHGKVVARSKSRRLKPGRHKLTMKVTRARYPTALKFRTSEGSGGGGGGNDDSNTVTS